MQPLAYRLRPKTFEDVIGQDHLVGKDGIITKMLNKNSLFSFILYGPAGSGKTTIAYIIKDMFKNQTFTFNASTDSKANLKDIILARNYYEHVILIIDEIHRMKKDIQDYLLPFLEDGSLIIIGLTTENPYRVINPAIRSRLHIYKMHELDETNLINLLKKASLKENIIINDDEIYKYIASASSLEIRTALNMLEVVSLIDENTRDLTHVKDVIGVKTIAIDGKGENYYDILSALIKSIRGSDVDASLHYLARFLVCEDLLMLTRRLEISAYEDIGMGNPQVGPRVIAACKAALDVGLPEARIPLAFAVVDLASSPKSNSTYLAIGKAIADLDNLKSKQIPPHILNKEIKGGANYLYPHDFPNDFVKQQYLPDELKNHTYYLPKENSKYEKALKEYLTKINNELKNL